VLIAAVAMTSLENFRFRLPIQQNEVPSLMERRAIPDFQNTQKRLNGQQSHPQAS
jgi:hypothetical protein